LRTNFEETIESSISLKKKLFFLKNEINRIVTEVYNCLNKGNKVLICGNGGSAADAQHLAAEFLIRLNPKINRRPFPVLNLAQDTSTITACGNDLGYENIFLRNLIAFGKKKDVLILISTSGNSKNIIKAANYAKKFGIKCIGFLGNKGGSVKKYCDYKLIVPSDKTARIQECHIFFGHYIFNEVEKLLLKKK
jgi:D-sedoheptulose 7-phosphate isomerase